MKRILTLLLIFPVLCHAQVIVTIAGNGIAGNTGDGGPATLANIASPRGIAIDPTGNVYFVSGSRIRKMDTAGIIITYAGTSVYGHTGDGGPATAAELYNPYYIALDTPGNLYAAEGLGNCIRKITPGGIITTIAGTGVAGYNGDGIAATAAQLNFPRGLAVDNAGNIFISDGFNYRIRMINTAGVISTFAGTGIAGYTGDGGPAIAARIPDCYGITVTGDGILFIADGNRCIRKVGTGGIINTIAGGSTPGYSGDGGPATAAQLNISEDVAIDGYGNVYIADVNNGRIRKVDAAGIITTIAGDGTMAGPGTGGYSGEYCYATDAALHNPPGVATDQYGDVYIADGNNHRVRKLVRDKPPYFVGGHTQVMSVCENSIANTINVLLTIHDTDQLQTEMWSAVMMPVHGTLMAADTELSSGTMVAPAGLYYTPATGYVGNDSFRVRIMDCGKLSDSTTIHVTVTSCPLSVNNSNSPSNSIRIFPSPATTVLNITAADKITSISISNLLGQTLYIQRYNDQQVHIDVAGLPAGTYIIRINGSELRRFVKE